MPHQQFTVKSFLSTVSFHSATLKNPLELEVRELKEINVVVLGKALVMEVDQFVGRETASTNVRVSTSFVYDYYQKSKWLHILFIMIELFRLCKVKTITHVLVSGWILIFII